MSKTVTVVLPTYNGEKYLKEQIDSILNQTYQSIQLMIADDMSQDQTRNILKDYETDERVKVFYQEQNQGVVKNIEFLLKQVKTPYYMLADQDDVWLSEKVEQSVALLEKENADLVFGDLEVVDENLKTIYPSFGDFMKLNRKIKKQLHRRELNYLYNCVTGCTILAKKETIQTILPFPTESKYCIHDHWMGLMVSMIGKLAYLEKTYIRYRQHGNNQVGIEKISHKFQKMEQVRDLFIDVKLGVFGTYIKYNERFPVEFQKRNEKAFSYFQMLKEKKYMNLKGLRTFHELYKNETFSYYWMNFVIMNLPLLGKGLFRIRYLFLKIRKKR